MSWSINQSSARTRLRSAGPSRVMLNSVHGSALSPPPALLQEAGVGGGVVMREGPGRPELAVSSGALGNSQN